MWRQAYVPLGPMAKTSLRAGESLETLTQTELREELEGFRRAMLSDAEGRVATVICGFTTDAAGAVNPPNGSSSAPPIYDVNLGWQETIHRLSVSDQAHTPDNPLSGANIGIAFYRNRIDAANLLYFTPEPGQTWVIPQLFTEGFHTAPVLRGGDLIVVQAKGLAVNTEFSVGLQVSRRLEA